MTHAAYSHEALKKKELVDTYTALAELVESVSKDAKMREDQLADARLVLAMALDVIKKGNFHPSVQPQVAGVKQQIRRAL